MSQALLRAVANCGRCIQYEAKGQLPLMQPIICTEPMELVHINYVGMEVTVATDKKPVVWNVLVVVDHFTRYVQAFITKNHTERTMAWVLYNNYFSVFGFPQRLMSDQGKEFCGKVIAAMCSLLGVEKIHGSQADDIVQPDVPVSSIVRVVGIDNLALDTTEDVNDILALDRSGLGTLPQDSHHSFFPQDVVPHLYCLWVFAGLQVLVILSSGNQVPFSGVAPGHILDNAKVRRVVVSVRCPFLWEGHCSYVQPAGSRKDPYYPISPSNQWVG